MTNPKQYYRPKTLTEALQLARQPDAVALAGGAMTLDALEVSFGTFVDLQDIPELKKIESVPAGYSIGGAVTLQQVVDLPDLHPVIRRSLTRSVSLNHRNGTSVAESLLQAQRFPEWMGVLAALDAGIEQVYPDGSREIHSLTDRLSGQGKEKLGTGIMSALYLALYADYKQALGASFVARTPADDPIVCAAVYIRMDADANADIVFPAVCGIAPQPVIVESKARLQDAPLSENAIRAFVDNLDLDVTYSDYRGSADYRSEMARICLKRALMECLE